ncbi:PREDICTED: pumilio homolog 15-like [Camelina sativa]|uniref:S-protein homolog n=1 Tax=Camelina sativa TaxID=90675 RepID=A0ABM1RFH6_CAMSA|nr:PREDICTED: pumilio homolog 15-like [Camelina sativa]
MNSLLVLSIFIGLSIGLSNMLVSAKSKVVISNQLEHNKLLKVHCHSKSDDLGEHILKIGEEYEFRFNNNIWSSTLFWCRMEQGPHYRHYRAFVVYKTSWRHPTCKWIAAENGIYLSQDGNSAVYEYQWVTIPPSII